MVSMRKHAEPDREPPLPRRRAFRDHQRARRQSLRESVQPATAREGWQKLSRLVLVGEHGVVLSCRPVPSFVTGCRAKATVHRNLVSGRLGFPRCVLVIGRGMAVPADRELNHDAPCWGDFSALRHRTSVRTG